jgi:hypothetical protein
LSFLILLLAALAAACHPSARSHRSYDEIRDLVAGKTGAEVEHLLGPPDVRQTVLDDQRWIWWSYTFLDGDQYAPEIRGQTVHLEVTLQKPPGRDAPTSPRDWRVNGPLAVSYTLPAPRS